MKRRTWMTVFALALAAGCTSPPPQAETSAISAERGGELYRDNCNACQTAQVHWRDKRLVKTWDELRTRV